MNYKEKYTQWINSDHIDQETKIELQKIDNEKEIEDRFYKDLEFGTGGLRGIIGAGTNRINKYTIRRATQGLANHLLKNSQKTGVAIAYDSRHKSQEFAYQAAAVLSANNIKAYVFETLSPTPELSFAVRHLNCAGGIVITASHNPAEYNGYKVYGEDGGQIVTEIADKIIHEIAQIKDDGQIKYIDEKISIANGMIEIIGEEVDKAYIEKVKTLSLREDVDKDIKIIYTPLHGTGNIPVRRVLAELDYKNVVVVPEQELPDSEFSTVKSPNPEEHAAFTLALELAEKEGADILLGTDPDCDRIGAVVKNNKGAYQVLTGNQTGALLIEYTLKAMKEKNTLPKNPLIIKTIVTSKMGEKIAKAYGVDTLDTLTGFKFIGEKIKEFEETKEKQFIFGYEESYGYLAGTFVRDKDAVIAAMLICEMAAYYKSKGMTLYDALLNLYKEYGYFKEDLVSITLKGKEGIEKINKIIESLRKNPPKVIAGKEIKIFRDYNASESSDLPKSNVLHFTFTDNSWFCVRPSGTEPKIKIYFSIIGETLEDANQKLKNIKDAVMEIINIC
ncbi:phospho-sugar mutase [Lutibacter sp. B2]|nr:phospho-sugar mutase [Lutibacter sp. B2]